MTSDDSDVNKILGHVTQLVNFIISRMLKMKYLIFIFFADFGFRLLEDYRISSRFRMLEMKVLASVKSWIWLQICLNGHWFTSLLWICRKGFGFFYLETLLMFFSTIFLG
ncbi:hypothetical protein RhiirC2_706069 [Rhizophagus irregularis]|uniref:Uncharacterized protein n=1 Tax=Rhizophagus irregularis TaxID=588596 RepID=A0A2N1NW67_9GLOM|nr:hypothetical protein RhiirC2_706069 [Rhizophagus irregularis]